MASTDGNIRVPQRYRLGGLPYEYSQAAQGDSIVSTTGLRMTTARPVKSN